MAFMGFPFAARPGGDPRRFPGHTEVLDYLRRFADHFDLRGAIRLDHTVERVEQVGDAGWRLSYVCAGRRGSQRCA